MKNSIAFVLFIIACTVDPFPTQVGEPVEPGDVAKAIAEADAEGHFVPAGCPDSVWWYSQEWACTTDTECYHESLALLEKSGYSVTCAD